MKSHRHHLCYFLLLLLLLPGELRAAEDPVWCEYEELGHMTPRRHLVIFTNGLFRVWKRPPWSERERPPRFLGEGTLTSDQRIYLAMWLEATDFINRPPGNQVMRDGEREMRLHAQGKTNSVCSYMEHDELGHLDLFCEVLIFGADGLTNAAGHRATPSVEVPLTSNMVSRYELIGTPSDRPPALLKEYIAGPALKADLLSEACRFLSKLLSPQDWADSVAACLKPTNQPQRQALVEALTSPAYRLQVRISEQHWDRIKPFLAGIGQSSAGQQLVPLIIPLPRPPMGSVLVDLPNLDSAHLEKLPDRPRPPMMVPPGTTNLALFCRVMASDTSVPAFELQELADGRIQSRDGARDTLLLRSGVQWLQLDLGGAYPLQAVVVWHPFWPARVFHGIVVQIADDAEFRANVRTLFNNDYKNLVSQGEGGNKEYFETSEGKLIPAKGQVARFVRLYSAGSTYSRQNEYLGVNVYGLPNVAR